MIISGRVQSITGLINIEDLKEGDTVISQDRSPCEVKSIKKVNIKKALQSTFNSNLIISDKSKIYSLYGEQEVEKNKTIYIKEFNNSEHEDLFKEVKATQAYDIKVNGFNYIIINGYPVEVKKC